MAIQYINTGSGANAGDGDSIRSAFIKVNNNFKELSTASWAISSSTRYYDVLPYTNLGYNIGSSSQRWNTVNAKTLSLETVTVASTSGFLTVNGNRLSVTEVGVNPPYLPSIGTTWYDTTNGRLYVYYGGTWVDASPGSGSGGSSDFLSVDSSILPRVDFYYDIGSVSKKWNNLYLGGDIVINNVPVSINYDRKLTIDGVEYRGVQGVQGTQGSQGISGIQGTMGIQGLQGTQGTEGMRGIQGVQGVQGTTGIQGVQGTTGIQGVQGVQGTDGIPGVQGTQGPPADQSLNTTSNVTFASVTATSITAGVAQNTTSTTQVGYLVVPQNATSTSYTLALSDQGKHIYSTTMLSSQVITIPPNNTVAFPIGTAVTLVLQGLGSLSINTGTGVTMYLAGSSSPGNRVLTAYGMATLMKVSTNTWFINGTGLL